MKLHPAFLLFAALLAIPAALSAASFEGKVRMKMSDARGGSHEIEQRIREGFVRTDMGTAKGQTASIIMDLNKREMLILMPEQRMYMVRPLPDVGSATTPTSTGPAPTFEKTGETAKILGYDCTKYISTAKGVVTDVWVTEELGRFTGLGGGPGPMGMGRKAEPPKAAWEVALAGRDFFPLRVISHDAKGAEKFRLEVVEIDKSPQPASLFAPPEGFQKLDLGGMMQGLGLPTGR